MDTGINNYSNFTFGKIGDWFTTPEGKARRQEKRDTKNAQSQSEAQLNAALAAAAAKNDSGMGAGTIAGLVALGLAVVIGGIIIYKKKKG